MTLGVDHDDIKKDYIFKNNPSYYTDIRGNQIDVSGVTKESPMQLASYYRCNDLVDLCFHKDNREFIRFAIDSSCVTRLLDKVYPQEEYEFEIRNRNVDNGEDRYRVAVNDKKNGFCVVSNVGDFPYNIIVRKNDIVILVIDVYVNGGIKLGFNGPESMKANSQCGPFGYSGRARLIDAISEFSNQDNLMRAFKILDDSINIHRTFDRSKFMYEVRIGDLTHRGFDWEALWDDMSDFLAEDHVIRAIPLLEVANGSRHKFILDYDGSLDLATDVKHF